jgi:hypothetical protein
MLLASLSPLFALLLLDILKGNVTADRAESLNVAYTPPNEVLMICEVVDAYVCGLPSRWV